MPDPFRHGHDVSVPRGGWPRDRQVPADPALVAAMPALAMAGNAWESVVVGRLDPGPLVAALRSADAATALALRAPLVNDLEGVRHAMGLRAEAFLRFAAGLTGAEGSVPDAAGLATAMAERAATRAAESLDALRHGPSDEGNAVRAAGLCAEGEEAWRTLERLEAAGLDIPAGRATELRKASAHNLDRMETVGSGLGSLYAATARLVPSRGTAIVTGRTRAEEDLSDLGGGYLSLSGIGPAVAGLRAGYRGDVIAASFADGAHPLDGARAVSLAALAGGMLAAYHATFNEPGFGTSLRQAACLLGLARERGTAHGTDDGVAALRDGLEAALAAADGAPDPSPRP